MLSQCNTKPRYQYAYYYLETDIPTKEGKIVTRKGKIIMLKEETNQQARKKMYNSMKKII